VDTDRFNGNVIKLQCELFFFRAWLATNVATWLTIRHMPQTPSPSRLTIYLLNEPAQCTSQDRAFLSRLIQDGLSIIKLLHPLSALRWLFTKF